MSKKEAHSLYLDEQQQKALRKHSAETGMPQALMMRKALDEWLDKHVPGWRDNEKEGK